MKDTREIGRIAAISVKCKTCGKVFAMDRREILWYSNMGYPLPKRCPDCRKKRKEMKELEKRVAALEKQAQEQQKTNKVDITFSKPTQQLSDQSKGR